MKNCHVITNINFVDLTFVHLYFCIYCTWFLLFPCCILTPAEPQFHPFPVKLLQTTYGADTCEHKNAFRTRSAHTGEHISLHMRVQAYTLAVHVVNVFTAFFLSSE